MEIDRKRIAEFCRRWKIAEFSLFGSALREDFETQSDVDVLVGFEADIPGLSVGHAGRKNKGGCTPVG